MKKSIDFSDGVRGKHVGTGLRVLGAGKASWAVCVSSAAADLVAFKLYKIERFDGSDDVRVSNEDGNFVYYPASWFASIDIPVKTLGILEKAI